jgi:drug/metabolite transporter (DMT)-like permease
MIIGTLPVVIAVTANRRGSAVVRARDGQLPWARLAMPLLLIAAGIGCVNQAELGLLRAAGSFDPMRHLGGAALAVVAVACWTWYPIVNADWLREHPGRSPASWATAQGLATLPLALAAYALWWAWEAVSGSGFSMPLGPRPLLFAGLMLAIGLLASWLGTLCWNEASQRLPPALAGQLIVFETLAALAYALIWRGEAPAVMTLLGAALLVLGVVVALRGGAARPRPA